jgi:hypothetical protein
MHEKHPCIDSPHQSISNGMWNATWFLIDEEICPLKYDNVKFAPKVLQTRSYGSTLNLSK